MKQLPICLALLLALPVGAVAQTSSSLNPRVRVETTAGAFVIELDAARAPLTAENFLRYVRDGFYNGLIMHRIFKARRVTLGTISAALCLYLVVAYAWGGVYDLVATLEPVP